MPAHTQDRFRGCLVGGAVGDALGYAVEFSTLDCIRRRYGSDGLRSYELICGKALISDDTQMTLFTANGLLLADTIAHRTGSELPAVVGIWRAYLDWLATQNFATSSNQVSWLCDVKELHSSRAPGNTCVHALNSGIMGTIEQPLNRSKGCGGVMRVAPIGLFYDRSRLTLQQICDIGASAAAITHGHPLGYMSAEALVFIINSIIYGDSSGDRKDDGLLGIVLECRDYFLLRYPGNKHAGEMVELLDKAICLSGQSIEPSDAIAQLGEGWVGEEALAIAVYCALRFSDSFDEAVIAAVNHDGDSDSTGAITGNIIGAYLGEQRISSRFTDQLELRGIIEQIADDLLSGCPEQADAEWDKRYFRKII